MNEKTRDFMDKNKDRWEKVYEEGLQEQNRTGMTKLERHERDRLERDRNRTKAIVFILVVCGVAYCVLGSLWIGTLHYAGAVYSVMYDRMKR